MSSSEQENALESLEDIVGEIGDLPTLPSVITQITSMTSNPQTNAADIGKLIGNDPSLSSKILKLINSAYYGFPRKIQSVTKAIVLLGFNKVKNIALSASVLDAFKDKNSQSIPNFDFYQFWEHSVSVGICAEVVAKHTRAQLTDDAFIGGLLHDVGKVIIAIFLEEGADIFANAEATKRTFSQAALEKIEIDEAKVGALLAEHWNFPENLVRSIRYSIHPDKTRQFRDVVGCIHLGKVLASSLGFPATGDHAMPVVSRQVWEELELEESKIEVMLQDSLVGFRNATAFLELAKD